MILPDVKDFFIALLHNYEVVDEIRKDHEYRSTDGSNPEEKVLWIVLGTFTNPCIRQRLLVSKVYRNHINNNNGETSNNCDCLGY